MSVCVYTKKIVGGDYLVFLAYEARILNILYSDWTVESNGRKKQACATISTRSLFFFNSFRWIEIRKEKDTRKNTRINDARGFGRYYQV